MPHARVHAAENAVDAFIWAKENFAAHAPGARLAFIDLASAFPELDGQVAVLVSNPPYVPDAAVPRDPEVRYWDPPSALYGGEDGPDLANVARHSGLTEKQVVELHASVEYVVWFLGFQPGFPYLGGLPERLAMPRHAEPRLRVPAGSVGIGGAQTGVYPLATPGGWQLLGRTPLALFDPMRQEPVLLRAGDRVRFVPQKEGIC